MNDLLISSLQNPRIKAAIKLRDRRGRTASGLLLIEGFSELDLAWRCGVVPQELFFCAELARTGELVLRDELRAAGTRIFTVTAAVMGSSPTASTPTPGWRRQRCRGTHWRISNFPPTRC